MKKFIFTMACLAVATSSFAYYDSYSRSSDGLTIMGIIMIVAGILQIILFFKIWGMTNNIKALKKDHFCETQFENKALMARYLRKNLILGNMDNVKRILLQNFIDNVENGYKNLKTGEYVNGNKWVDFKEDNLKKPIAPYIKNLMLQYAKIGEEVPVYIMRMETFDDFYKLFVERDLIVEEEKKEEKKEENQ